MQNTKSKQKQEKYLKQKILEENCVKVFEINSHSYQHYEEKVRVNKSRRNYILFRMDD